MNRTVRSALSVILSFLLIALSVAGLSVFAEDGTEITVIAQGNCGVLDAENHPTDNVTYTITSDGVMTVSGAGAMADITSLTFGFGGPEWRKYHDPEIKSVVIEPGVTSIGDFCFREMSELRRVSIADTVVRIGKDAFRKCPKLIGLTIPDSVRILGEKYLYDCDQVEEVVLPAGLEVITENSFYGCNNLRRITIPASVRAIEKNAFAYCEKLYCVYYLAPLARWQTIAIDDTRNGASLLGGGNSALDHADIHSHYPGGGTSVYESRNAVAAPTCARAAGFDRVEICSLCGRELSSAWIETAPAAGHLHTVSVPAAEATASEHGYTEGVYCADCETWLSGHEVIHNTLGERTYLDEYTEDGEQMVIIVCTVCGGLGLYAAEPAPAPEAPANDAPSSGIRNAIRGIIDFFLRLIKWLSAAG